MNRRHLLAAVGGLGLSALAGCLGDEEYETYTYEGVDVPLVPVDDVYDWYDAGEAVMVDVQHEEMYERLRIENALLSPAPNGRETDDPLDALDRDERIVLYCTCPHSLAGMRGSALIDDGYTAVYALKEGLHEWRDRGYPVAGTDVS